MIYLVAFLSIVFGGLALASEAVAAIIPKNFIATFYAATVGTLVLAYEAFFIPRR